MNLFGDLFDCEIGVFQDFLGEKYYYNDKTINYHVVDGEKCIYINMAGVKKEDLTVVIENDILKIVGTRRFFGKETKLRKNIKTSSGFDVTKVSAKLEDGVLMLSIPQHEEKPTIKEITVK